MRLTNWMARLRYLGRRSGVSPKRGRRAGKSPEMLASRVLLAAAFAPAKVTAEWFATPDGSSPVQEPVGAAQPGRGLQWSVELTPEARELAPNVKSAAELLQSQAAGARVVRGLGLQGSLLVQTRMGDFEETRAWLASQPGVARVSADAEVSVAAVPNDPSYGSL